MTLLTSPLLGRFLSWGEVSPFSGVGASCLVFVLVYSMKGGLRQSFIPLVSTHSPSSSGDDIRVRVANINSMACQYETETENAELKLELKLNPPQNEMVKIHRGRA